MDYRLDKRDWSDWVFAGFAVAGVLAVTWLAVAVSRPAAAQPEAAPSASVSAAQHPGGAAEG